MILDTRTLMLAHAAQSVILCFIIGLNAYQNRKRIKGPMVWFLGYVFYDIGVLLVALRGFVPDFLSFEIGNLLFLAGASCVPLGCAMYLGRPPRFDVAALGLTITMTAYSWFLHGYPSFLVRITLFSGWIALCYLYAGVYLIVKIDKTCRWNAAVAFVFLMLATAINVVRLVGHFAGPEQTSIFMSDGWDALYYLQALIIMPGVAYGQLQLVNGALIATIRRDSDDRALLVREMNHRVKNNLALAESLVSLEKHRASNRDFLSTLDSLGRRLHSIALVHDKLSHVESGGTIRVDGYLAMVLDDLRGNGANAFIEADLEPLEMRTQNAVPLGLVTNELVTNALKYATQEGRTATVTITLEASDGQATLTVRDDGPGFPAPAAKRSDGPRQGLGSMLLDALAMQLDGTLTRRNEGGAVAELRFPLDPR